MIIGSRFRKSRRGLVYAEEQREIVYHNDPKNIMSVYPNKFETANMLHLPAGVYKMKMDCRGVCTLVQIAYYV